MTDKRLITILVGAAAIAVAGTTGTVVAVKQHNARTYKNSLESGKEYMEENDYADAELALIEAIEADPDEEEPYTLLYELYSENGQPEAAVKILEDGMDHISHPSDQFAALQQSAYATAGVTYDTDTSDDTDSSAGTNNGTSEDSDKKNTDTASGSDKNNSDSKKKDSADTDSSKSGSSKEKSDSDTEVPTADDRPVLVNLTDDTDTDASVSSYSTDSSLSNVTNLDQFYLSDKAKQLLAENLFAVSSDSRSYEFYELYETNRYKTVPNFVTVDSMMHTYHLYFSYLLKNTEKNHLSEELLSLSKEMLSASESQLSELKGTEWEDAALNNVAFFSTAVSLQDDSFTPDSSVSDTVSKELSLISGAGGLSESPTTGAQVDYSQFKPRGYYEGDSVLEAYFRAMMWYGQNTFQANDEEASRSALLINLALDSDGISDWESIYTVTSFFAGASDDLSYYELMPAIRSAYGDSVTAASLAGNDSAWKKYQSMLDQMDPPKINCLGSDDSSSDSNASNKGYRFMGQRFTIDESVFENLIYASVSSNSSGENRLLPDTLDVAAALGSDTALDILTDEGATEYAGYSENMEELRSELSSDDTILSNGSLYSGWLYTLEPLLEEKTKGYPSFMQSTEWLKKDLETFAGSYAELKHDTVLYAKQVMAEMGGDNYAEDDRGYVEPEVNVYTRFASLARQTSEGLNGYGYLDSEDAENLELLATMADQFKEMSEKELNNETLSDEEYDLIREYGGNLEHFWLKVASSDLGTDSPQTHDYPAALITDVATGSDTCLEIGTGSPCTIYVIVPVDGSLRICCGAVYSFYQFEQPVSDRLTDSTWRQKLGIQASDSGSYNYNNTVDQPEWTDSYHYSSR